MSSHNIAKTAIARIEYEYDLLTAEPKYHNTSFLRPTTRRKSVRPQNEAIHSTTDEIFTYMENCDDYQFSLE